MLKYFTITIFAILLILLVLPQVASAALVPCGRQCNEWSKDMKQCLVPGKGVPLEEAQPCTLCHVFKLFQKITNGVGFIAMGWAALFIVIGGIMILASAGVADKVSQGKRMITYAIVGVVIIFGAWVIINTVMNALVNPGKMPWPWNRVTCVPTESVIPPSPPSTKGEYCICETPRYAYTGPGDDLNTASVVGTDIKVTQLASKEECSQGCVSGNFGNYCYRDITDLPSEKYNLYCTDQSSVTAKQACGMTLKPESDGQGCRIGNECYPTDDECMNAALTTYVRKCYLDGLALCDYHAKGGSSYCIKASSKGYSCNGHPDYYVLYRWMAEAPSGSYNAVDCSRYASGNYYCRLNCQYEKCLAEEPTNWCNEVKSSFSCFGSFTCKNMTTSQEGNACDQLKEFLNCMGKKNMPAGAKEISSISDNSKYKCFDTSYWDSKGQCSGATDSCTGTCCGHSKYSLHYGGKPPGEGGVAGCRTCSWAIDFANEQYYQGIKNVAEVCANELKYGKVDVIYEGNHVHVELDEVARTLRCQ